MEQKCYEGGRLNGWNPKGGSNVILKQIEFDKRVLNDLRDLAEEDGVKSVYQEIRNACYHYVQMRKRRAQHVQTDDMEFWTA